MDEPVAVSLSPRSWRVVLSALRRAHWRATRRARERPFAANVREVALLEETIAAAEAALVDLIDPEEMASL